MTSYILHITNFLETLTFRPKDCKVLKNYVSTFSNKIGSNMFCGSVHLFVETGNGCRFLKWPTFSGNWKWVAISGNCPAMDKHPILEFLHLILDIDAVKK